MSMKPFYLTLVVASSVAACGLRSPGPSDEYAWTNRNHATPEQVRPELLQCGNPPVVVAPSTEPAIKLQNQVQKDSTAQMNQLLRIGSRK